MTIDDLLNDNHACHDPQAGRWISEARGYLKKYSQAQQEAYEQCEAIMQKVHDDPLTSSLDGLRAIRALMRRED